LWIHEVRFSADSLQESKKLDFVRNTFALNGIDIDEETVDWEFQVLLHKGYISEQITFISEGITGDEQIKDYFLTSKGASIAEELFDKMKMLVSTRSESPPIAPKMESAINSHSTTQPVSKPKKLRKRVSEKDIRKAVKLVVDEGMTQNDAEKACGLPQSTLSRGEGGKILGTYIKMAQKLPVDKKIGENFLYNEK
jgi:hypothetical protein